MGFSADLRSKCAASWDLEKRHPFVTGIGDGTLPLDIFRYFMRQDYVYLVEFSRAIAIAAAKAKSIDDMGWFARLLHETLNTEMALHVSFCAEFGITEQELESTSPSPTTLAYARHLTGTAFHEEHNHRLGLGVMHGLLGSQRPSRFLGQKIGHGQCAQR